MKHFYRSHFGLFTGEKRFVYMAPPPGGEVVKPPETVTKKPDEDGKPITVKDYKDQYTQALTFLEEVINGNIFQDKPIDDPEDVDYLKQQAQLAMSDFKNITTPEAAAVMFAEVDAPVIRESSAKIAAIMDKYFGEDANANRFAKQDDLSSTSAKPLTLADELAKEYAAAAEAEEAALKPYQDDFGRKAGAILKGIPDEFKQPGAAGDLSDLAARIAELEANVQNAAEVAAARSAKASHDEIQKAAHTGVPLENVTPNEVIADATAELEEIASSIPALIAANQNTRTIELDEPEMEYVAQREISPARAGILEQDQDRPATTEPEPIPRAEKNPATTDPITGRPDYLAGRKDNENILTDDGPMTAGAKRALDAELAGKPKVTADQPLSAAEKVQARVDRSRA